MCGGVEHESSRIFYKQSRQCEKIERRRTPARGHPPRPLDPRPYYATMQVLVVHSRDGGGADAVGGPSRASVYPLLPLIHL